MTESTLELSLAALILVGRVGDILSTWIVTPTLVLEANPLARRLGWKFALATLLTALIPFYHTGIGLVCVVVSFLVTWNNLSRAWIVRAIGEHEYLAILRAAAQRSPRWIAHACIWGSAAAMGLMGAILYFFASGLESWAGWFALGMLTFAVAFGVHGSYGIQRVYQGISGAPSSAVR